MKSGILVRIRFKTVRIRHISIKIVCSLVFVCLGDGAHGGAGSIPSSGCLWHLFLSTIHPNYSKKICSFPVLWSRFILTRLLLVKMAAPAPPPAPALPK